MTWSKTYHPSMFNFLMTCHLVVGVLYAALGLSYGMTQQFESGFAFYVIICLLVVGIVMSSSTHDNSATMLGFGLVIGIVTIVFLPMLVRHGYFGFEELRSAILLVGIAFAVIGISGTVLPGVYGKVRDAFIVSTILILAAIVLPDHPGVTLWMRIVAAVSGYYVACAMYLHSGHRPKTLNRALAVGPKGYLVFFRGIALVGRKLGFGPMAADDK